MRKLHQADTQMFIIIRTIEGTSLKIEFYRILYYDQTN